MRQKQEKISEIKKELDNLFLSYYQESIRLYIKEREVSDIKAKIEQKLIALSQKSEKANNEYAQKYKNCEKKTHEKIDQKKRDDNSLKEFEITEQLEIDNTDF